MILIIDNYDSFTYNLYQIVAQLDANIKVVRNNEISLDEIAILSPTAIIISPGPGKPEDAGICVDMIRQFSGIIPILGICLGHQAIAHAFGASVIQATQMMHGKRSLIFHNRSALYQSMNLPFQAGRYHSLIVEKSSLPKTLIIEAETGDGIIMGIKHIKHPTFGMQFHPESILSDSGSRILENFIKHCYSGATLC
jgi:anthranilate synthase component II